LYCTVFALSYCIVCLLSLSEIKTDIGVKLKDMRKNLPQKLEKEYKYFFAKKEYKVEVVLDILNSVLYIVMPLYCLY